MGTDLPNSSFEPLYPKLFRGNPEVDTRSTSGLPLKSLGYNGSNELLGRSVASKYVINKTWPQILISWHQFKTWPQKLISWHQFKTWPQKLIKWHQFKTWPQKVIKWHQKLIKCYQILI